MHTDYLNLADRHRPLQTQARSQIYGQHRRGDSVEALARQFSQSPTTIRRIINAMRAAHILQLPLDHVGNAQFAPGLSRKMEVEILGPPPESNLPTKTPQPPKNVSAYVASLYEVPLLTFEQEVHLFRKMNYLKYKASALRAGSIGTNPRAGRWTGSRSCTTQLWRPGTRSSVPIFGWWSRSPSGTWVRRATSSSWSAMETCL